MAKSKTITERIREYYCSDDNTDEWLVEKGKVKEGRLLKEACETLEALSKKYDNLSIKHNELVYKNILDKNEITDPYQDKIYKLKHKLNDISSYMKSLEFKNKDSLHLIKSIVNEINKK